MKIALIQIPLVWEDPKSNRAYIEQKINTLESDTDLVVLPEMFTTGFTMQPERVAETMQGETVVWMQSLAKAKNCAITGSLVIIEEGNFYNRLLFVFPSGEIHYYNKRHLFTLAGEDKSYTKGTQKLIIEYRGWKICPLICYDLRFPALFEALGRQQCDVIAIPAAFTVPTGAAHWHVLQRARAIEASAFVVAAAQVGQHEDGRATYGHSLVIDPWGEVLTDMGGDAARVECVELDLARLAEVRAQLPSLFNKRSIP